MSLDNDEQMSLNDLIQEGIKAQTSGNIIQAEIIYKKVLQYDPDNASVLPALGIISFLLQKNEQAFFYLEKSLEKQPEEVFNYVNMAKVLFKMNKLDKAISFTENSLIKFPNNDVLLALLGTFYAVIGNKEKFIYNYEKAIEINSKNFDCYNDFANALINFGELDKAIYNYEKALEVNPYSDKTYNNIANTYKLKNDNEKALRNYEKAITFSDDIIIHNNLGNFYYDVYGDYKKSQQIYLNLNDRSANKIIYKLAKLLKLPIIAKNNSEIHENKAKLKDFLKKDFSNYKFDYNDIVNLNLMPPYILKFYGENDLELKQSFYELFSNTFRPLPQNYIKNDRIHVAFIVSEGHEPIFVKCMGAFLEKLALRDFKISIICQFNTGLNEIRPYLRAKDIDYIQINCNDLYYSASIISACKIDILHHWEVGSDCFNYFLPFLKPAKIQVTSWGTSVTSGIKTMDYYISSKKLETDDWDKYYSEDLVLMEKIPVFYKKLKTRFENEDFKYRYIRKDKKLYLYNQNIRKLLPEHDILFGRILERDPKAIIGIIEDKSIELTNLLKNRILNNLTQYGNRIIFIPRLNHLEYLELTHSADVCLDINTYSGSNTSYDAFLCGVPMPHYKGKTLNDKFTEAIYNQANITDLTADNNNEYIEKLYMVANNEEYRKHLKIQINNAKDLVFEDIEVVDEFEKFVNVVCEDLY
ncbi:MAG: tetratricopeptide repeat protein [Candidatus Sericytochromatia bacterium]